MSILATLLKTWAVGIKKKLPPKISPIGKLISLAALRAYPEYVDRVLAQRAFPVRFHDSMHGAELGKPKKHNGLMACC